MAEAFFIWFVFPVSDQRLYAVRFAFREVFLDFAVEGSHNVKS